jgi:hypothetical protein
MDPDIVNQAGPETARFKSLSSTDEQAAIRGCLEFRWSGMYWRRKDT